MTEKDDWIDTFIAHLEALRDREERGALAALRRGVGSAPGSVASMYPQLEDVQKRIEKRLVGLLNSHREDLPHHLRQAVSLLKSSEIPIDWRQLLWDILYWEHESRFVQQQWAREFWQRKAEENPETRTKAAQNKIS